MMHTVSVNVVIAGLGVVVLIQAFIVFALLYRSRAKHQTSESLLMQEHLHELARRLEDRITENARKTDESLQYQMSESSKLIHETGKYLNEVTRVIAETKAEAKDANSKVFSIAEQLSSLERTLLHQKQRGSLGEESLKLVLENVLPPSCYILQHRFQDGDVVDAVVQLKDGFVPVDAKFSLDNFRRLDDAEDAHKREQLERAYAADIKKRIDETAKYIRPSEGTLTFAFMFVPAEGLYYDLQVRKQGRSLIEYAYRERNVFIVSPTTFAAYLHSVLYGFRAFQIEESSREIGARVAVLAKHISAYDTHFKNVGKSLNATVNHYNNAQIQMQHIDKDVFRITSESIGIKKLPLDRPLRGMDAEEVPDLREN